MRQWGVCGLVGRLCSLGRLAPVRELCSGGEICSSGFFLYCFQKARACPFLVLPLGPSDPQTLVPAPTHIPAPPPSSIPKLLCVASAPMGQITLGQVPDVRPPSPKVRFGVLNYVRWFWYHPEQGKFSHWSKSPQRTKSPHQTKDSPLAQVSPPDQRLPTGASIPTRQYLPTGASLLTRVTKPYAHQRQ